MTEWLNPIRCSASRISRENDRSFSVVHPIAPAVRVKPICQTWPSATVNGNFSATTMGLSPQLYDLAADRAEETNLAATRPEIVQRLTAELLSWHASMPPDGGPTYVSLSKAERKARALSRSQN